MTQIITFFVLSAFLVSCTAKKADPTKAKKVLSDARDEFKPIGPALIDLRDDTNRRLVALGKKLYFEKKLSIDHSISCNSCHNLKTFGVDNEKTSPGFQGKRGDRNSPTVFNAGFHIAQFWDGRAKDLAEQAIGPILNPVEMAMPSEAEVLKRLNTEEYLKMFGQAFPTKKRPLTYKNIGVAIAAFEKTLITPSRFDDFLEGDLSALDGDELQGLETFMEVGCVSCHNGAAVGGNDFQKLGAVKPYKTHDKGRFVVTKNKDDMHVFKVPSLRNIEHTGPYFHDGSIESLEKAIELMGRHQLGEELSSKQIDDIKSFLKALTGRIPAV